ncbi:transposable element Tcb2 transposase [Trichonephila clavipes]|nr:transposable element Tcb2 transposase [Trichonephila clavipes]
MQMSRIKHHRRHECTKNASGRHAQLKTINKGTAVRKIVGGHPTKTTAVDDRYIVLHAKRARYQSASAIAQQLCTITVRQVSRLTEARRLHKGGLFACRPERCIPLKVGHQWPRLECKSTKTGHLMNGIVFSLRMRVVSVPQATLSAS